MSIKKTLKTLILTGTLALSLLTTNKAKGKLTTYPLHEQSSSCKIFEENFDDEDINGRYDAYISDGRGLIVNGALEARNEIWINHDDPLKGVFNTPLPDVFEIRYDMKINRLPNYLTSEVLLADWNRIPGSIDLGGEIVGTHDFLELKNFQRINFRLQENEDELSWVKLRGEIFSGIGQTFSGTYSIPSETPPSVNVAIERRQNSEFEIYLNDTSVFKGQSFPPHRYFWIDGGDCLYDNIEIWTVPEPTTLGLLGAGGLVTLLACRRRKIFSEQKLG